MNRLAQFKLRGRAGDVKRWARWRERAGGLLEQRDEGVLGCDGDGGGGS